MITPQMIDRDLKGNAMLLRRAAVGAIVALLIVAVLAAFSRGAFDDVVRVSAVVDDAGGSLTPGSDVKVHGVIVGRVDGLEPVGDDHVRIRMTLAGRHARHVPAGVTARVLPATVFGTTYVDLVRTDGAIATTAHLVDGASLAQATDGKTLELQDTLDSTDRVLGAIEPAELATTLGAVAAALDGRGDEIGATMDQADAYLARLEPKLPQLREDLALSAQFLTAVNDAAPDLLSAVDDAEPTLKTLRGKSDDIGHLLRGGRGLTTTVDVFLRQYRALLIRAVNETALAFDALYDFRTGFPVGFRAFGKFAETATQGILNGPWLETEVFLKTGGDVPYTANDCPRYGPFSTGTAIGDNCPGAH